MLARQNEVELCLAANRSLHLFFKVFFFAMGDRKLIGNQLLKNSLRCSSLCSLDQPSQIVDHKANKRDPLRKLLAPQSRVKSVFQYTERRAELTSL